MELNNLEILPSSERPIKKCHGCGSIYITPKECESCGLQFGGHELGEPLGPRSFFSLREEYEKTQSFFSKKKSINNKNYRKNLILRFRALLEELEHSFDDIDNWNIFNYELLELARYLASFKENEYLLNKILLEKRDHPQFFELNKIAQGTVHVPRKKVYPYPFKNTLYFLGILALIVALNKIYFML
jgi:hypothetical protein